MLRPARRQLRALRQVDDLREVLRDLDQLDADAPSRGLGMPTTVAEVNVQLQYGQAQPLDPSSASADGAGVYLYADLPPADPAFIGEVVTVKNLSKSTHRIRVRVVVDGDSIEGDLYRDIVTAGGVITFKLFTATTWGTC